jgi:glycosyltransferase involved in cell wall biosynthesis
MRMIGREQLRAPARVISVELSSLPRANDINVEGYETLWCLTRYHGMPQSISFWDVGEDRLVSPGVIVDHLRAAGELDTDDTDAARSALVDSDVEVTVAICTHERPDDLRRALASLAEQHDSKFRTIVIDNAPRTRATADIVEESHLSDCDYLIEPQKGLSRARNAALAHISSEHVAWIDDDEIADADWIGRLKQGFRHASRPAAVCGLMLPAELETRPQILFEQYGGFNKGRDLYPEVLFRGAPSVVSPFYPLPAIGSGGNMAFRTESLRAAGGFDRDLGAGTRTHGGEETKVFCTLLRSDETVLHWPAAITWHFHRRQMDQLHKQFYGYSAGLSAFYASAIRSDPSAVWDIARLVPHALRDLGLRDGGIKFGQLPEDFPKELLSAGRRGLAAGAFSYVYEALHDKLGGWRV